MLRTMKDLAAADLAQCTEAALLLADAYEAQKQRLEGNEMTFKRAKHFNGVVLNMF